MATLRRDGFASMDADESGGTLTTRPLRFAGKHLFVNADALNAELSVEILDRDFGPITSVPMRADATKHRVRWTNAADADLAPLSHKDIRLHFNATRGVRLYSFWFSPDPSGASRGHVAAGGPEFTGTQDL
jgi:hypothetical protein